MNAWVLLRGLAREARHWGPFTATLAHHFPQVPVLAIDLPGNGQANLQTSPMHVAAITQACREAARAQGLRPPFGVVGMSLGAMVVAEWSQQQPHELACAVLINTSLRPFSPFHQRLRPSAWPGLLRAAWAQDPLRREREVWRLTSQRPAQECEAVVAAWAGFQRDRPVALRNALRQLLAAARYQANPAPPTVPTLLLCGAGDRLVHPGCSGAIARAWQLELRVHPQAGHDLPLDDPAWVAGQIEDWLGRQAQR